MECWYLFKTLVDWEAVAYGDGKFITVKQFSAGVNALSSTDGINWTDESTGFAMKAIAYGDGTFIGHQGNVTTNIYTSTDGSNWTQTSSAPSLNKTGIAYNPVAGRFAILGYNASNVITEP